MPLFGVDSTLKIINKESYKKPAIIDFMKLLQEIKLHICYLVLGTGNENYNR